MSCIVHIILAIIAFAIHPVIGVVWVAAQILGSLNSKEDTKAK